MGSEVLVQGLGNEQNFKDVLYLVSSYLDNLFTSLDNLFISI